MPIGGGGSRRMPLVEGVSASTMNFRGVSPIAKRIVFSWIATDVIWAALFIYVLKREER